uniref:Transcription termination factor MTEF1, chloroplastic-like n=4 Tax=Nicotiana TaxID=4085 RepID=A0A1S3ZWZ0_TOBAC
MSTPTKSFPLSPSPSCFSRALSPPIRTLFPSALLPSQKLTFAANTSQKQDKLPLHFLGPEDSRILLLKCNALVVNDSSTNSFVDSGVMLYSLFQEIGFNERDTEALLDAHPVVKLRPFQSIRTRIHSLQSLGVSGLALSRLIVKRPDVLTAQEIDAFVCFLLNDELELAGKIKPSQIEHLFNSTEPRFLAGFEAKVRLLLQLGMPQEKIVHVLNNANLTKAFCLKSFEDVERLLTFLNRFGGVDLILRRPALLNYDLDAQLIPRIGFLFELSGGDEAGTATVLRKLPFVVAYSVDHLKDHVE